MSLIRCIRDRAQAARNAALDEGGYLIVELMVGAIVMVILALGTLSAFDGAAKVSATTKTRAIAASLAQEEQERLRGLSVDQLNRLNSTSTQTIGGVVYTINSKSQWLADGTSSTSCQANGAAADYLKTTTTVTPNKSRLASDPVVLTSLVTAPLGTFASNQGSLAISVLDRNGTGLANLPLSAQGPSPPGGTTYSDTTDANGCVFLGYLLAGPYTISFSQPGYVDKWGNNAVASSGNTVTGESTSTASFDYDQAASATVNFDTVAYAASSAQTAYATKVNFEHANIAPAVRTFPPSGSTYVSSIPNTTITNLFPFASNYSVYAGESACTGTDSSPTSQILTPGASPTVTVRVPAINVTVLTKVGSSGAGTATAGDDVKATPNGTGCPAAFDLGTISQTTNAQGKFDHPEAPYGNYNLCADHSFSGTWRKSSTFKNGSTTVSQPIANTNANGTPNLTVTIYSSGSTQGSSNGQC